MNKDHIKKIKKKNKRIKTGSKVKYLGDSNWAYDHNGIYEVAGYDEELDAWGVIAKNGEIYAVGEADLEEI